MNIVSVVEASFGLIPDLVRADKLEVAGSAMAVLTPVLSRGPFTTQTILDLQSSGELKKVGAAIADVTEVLDALLAASPDNAAHVIALLTALGLPQK